jgi:hypothetical protein
LLQARGGRADVGRDMDQISPPMRIVLVVAIVFAAAYMLVLKPKDEAVAPAPEPAPAVQAGGPEANTALGQAVEQANEAANASEAANAARGAESTAGETKTQNPPATTQAAPGTQKPVAPADKAVAEDLKDLPGWLAESMDKRVVAVLFTNAESADDRRTSKALQQAYDYNGDVVTRVVNVKKISDYQAIAEGVDVSQSPTLMVIAKDRSAEVLTGFSSRNTISQAIIDARLVTDNPLDSVPFLQTVQSECRSILNTGIIGVTEGSTPAGARKNVQATVAEMGASLATLRKAKVPAAYRGVKAITTRWLASEIRVGNQLVAALGAKRVDPIRTNAIARSNDELAKRAQLQLNAVGVSSCN